MPCTFTANGEYACNLPSLKNEPRAHSNCNDNSDITEHFGNPTIESLSFVTLIAPLYHTINLIRFCYYYSPELYNFHKPSFDRLLSLMIKIFLLEFKIYSQQYSTNKFNLLRYYYYRVIVDITILRVEMEQVINDTITKISIIDSKLSKKSLLINNVQLYSSDNFDDVNISNLNNILVLNYNANNIISNNTPNRINVLVFALYIYDSLNNNIILYNNSIRNMNYSGLKNKNHYYNSSDAYDSDKKQILIYFNESMEDNWEFIKKLIGLQYFVEVANRMDNSSKINILNINKDLLSSTTYGILKNIFGIL